jgi:hypothetical protein
MANISDRLEASTLPDFQVLNALAYLHNDTCSFMAGTSSAKL